jgi:hypothetical protein
MGASNRELKAEIEALSAELGVSPPDGLMGMNNPRLVEALEGLQARKASGAAPAPAASGQEALPLAAGAPGVAAADVPPPDGDAPQVAPHAEAPPVAAAAPTGPAPAAALPFYAVAEGKSISRGGRVFGSHEQIKAHYLGGQQNLDELVALGSVVRTARLRS